MKTGKIPIRMRILFSFDVAMAQFYRHVQRTYLLLHQNPNGTGKTRFRKCYDKINKLTITQEPADLIYAGAEVVGKWTRYLSHYYYLVAVECIQVHLRQWLMLTPSNGQVYEQTNEIKTHWMLCVVVVVSIHVETIVLANSRYAAASSIRVHTA